MNIALNPTQSNTKRGIITLTAHDNLTGLEGYLWKIGDDSGTPKFYLPAAVTDLALYVGASGDIAGNDSSGEVPQDGNFRVKAYGTGLAGDILVLADPTANGGAQAGMVRSLTGSHAPATGGRYFRIGIAEEDFVDGQLVLARFAPGDARIASAFNATGTEATDIAALKTILEAHGIVA